MKLVIVTTDGDFAALPNLPRENWTLDKSDRTGGR
jgi:hypothetical protein